MMAASVAVSSAAPRSTGTLDCVLAIGRLDGGSLSRECRQEHPERATDKTSRPAGEASSKYLIRDHAPLLNHTRRGWARTPRLPHDRHTGMPPLDAGQLTCYTGTGLGGTRFNVNFVRWITRPPPASEDSDRR